MTYGTTPGFLEYFGLRSLEDLPAADELRRVVVQKPEALATVDPGLATAPPEQLTLPAENAKPVLPAKALPAEASAQAGGVPVAGEQLALPAEGTKPEGEPK